MRAIQKYIKPADLQKFRASHEGELSESRPSKLRGRRSMNIRRVKSCHVPCKPASPESWIKVEKDIRFMDCE